ncbi:hypothetical protein DP49_3999 [Burkholderia pseudomallei]|nr:hypothetical protein DP49_3999 [Burkholderia pseudomallei]
MFQRGCSDAAGSRNSAGSLPAIHLGGRPYPDHVLPDSGSMYFGVRLRLSPSLCCRGKASLISSRQISYIIII